MHSSRTTTSIVREQNILVNYISYYFGGSKMPFFKSKEEKEAKRLAKQAEREENLRKADEYSKRRIAEIERESAERQARIEAGDTKMQRAFEKAGDKVAGVVVSAGTGVAQKIIDFGNDGLDRVYGNFEAHLKTNYPHYYEEISQISDITEKRNRMDEIDKKINKSPKNVAKAPQADVSEELRKLKQLEIDGIISSADFEAKKKQLLGL